MATDWTTVPLGSVCTIYDGPHATPAKTTSGPVFLGISSLQRGRLDLSASERLSEEHFIRWTRRVTPRAGDVVFSYETRIGEAAIIPEGLRCCLGRRLGLLRGNPSKVDPRFLLYAYLGPEFQDTLRARTIHGSTVERIALIELPAFPITLPPLPEQKAIASILGALDDKIELNRRMNETLDAIARAIFKSWFVDCDPVRAKAATRSATLAPDIAGLFAHRFVDSSLGPIPEGWEARPLGECGEWVSGGTPDKSRPEYWDGDIPWVSAKSLHDFIITDSSEKVTAEGATAGSTTVPEGAVLFLVRGMSLASEFRIGVAGREVAFNQDVKAIIPKRNVPSSLLAYFLLHRTPEILDLVDEASHGTKRLQTDLMKALAMILPTDASVIARLASSIDPLVSLQKANTQQVRTLADLRDTLLPKLLSGEVRVKEAEKMVEAMV